jgi:CubicO group peptidase (beta-lactamase class C family)
MKKWLALLLTLLMLCTMTMPGWADAIDDYVQNQMREQRIPGLSLAVVQNDRLVKAKGYGLANIELNVPVAPESVFQSGSVGKQFTAAAVMLLVEAGKINLDDKISRSLPGTPSAWQGITIRHLLTHTSGIKDYEEGTAMAIDFRRDYTDEELVARAAAMSLDFAPGEKWKYSNTGYVLLGIIIKNASGQFYGDLLSERVFKPLGMQATRVITEADIVPGRAAGYRLENDALKNQAYVSPSLNRTADGSLYLTVLDMVKWDAALGTEKLLKKSSFDAIWTPVTLNDGKTYPYGFGWALGSVAGRRLIEHAGQWQGFTAHIARYVDDKLTIVVLANLAEANPSRIAHGIAGLYVPTLGQPQSSAGR